MTEAQAKRMGFKPWPEGIWNGPQYAGYWRRELKRPQCKEYWHPGTPNLIRREWYSSPHQTSPSYQVRATNRSRSDYPA